MASILIVFLYPTFIFKHYYFEKDFNNKNNFISDSYLDFSLDPFVSNKKFNINGGGYKISFEIPQGGNTFNNTELGASCYHKEGNNTITTDNHFITIKVINYRVYISFTVKDLKTGEIIAQMDNNIFKVKKVKISTYFPSDDKKSIKIVDNYGNVAFEIWQDINKDIQVRGYSVGAYCTLFYYGETLDVVYKNDPEYMEKVDHFAERMTEKIK